jgi:hypothetical protein
MLIPISLISFIHPCKILYMRSLGEVSQEEYIRFLVEISVENGRECSQEFSIQNLDISLLRIFRVFSILLSREKQKSSLLRIFDNSQKSFRMKNSSILLCDFMSILSRDTYLIFLTKKSEIIMIYLFRDLSIISPENFSINLNFK